MVNDAGIKQSLLLIAIMQHYRYSVNTNYKNNNCTNWVYILDTTAFANEV